MDPLRLVASWHELISRAFGEHTLAAAVVTIAAIGIFVVLQQELRPYHLASNAAYVAAGWLVSVSVLVPVMAALRRGWALLEQAAPLLARLSAYLYGIVDRHPLLALVVVGTGTTAYFLERLWPRPLSWGPVRALCALFGIALAIHVAGPLADLVDAAPQAAAPAKPQPLAVLAPAEAVARAVQAGDTRYLSVPHCVDQVVGEVPSPTGVGVKGLGPNCRDTLGDETALRLHRHQAYAAAYNRLMFKYNNAAMAASLKAE
jgi:hypothetical protein